MSHSESAGGWHDDDGAVDAYAVVDAMVHHVNWALKSDFKHPGALVQLENGGMVSLPDILDPEHKSILYRFDRKLGSIAAILGHSFEFYPDAHPENMDLVPKYSSATRPLDSRLLDVLLEQPSQHYTPLKFNDKRPLLSTAVNIKQQPGGASLQRRKPGAQHRVARASQVSPSVGDKSSPIPDVCAANPPSKVRRVGDLPGCDLLIVHCGYAYRLSPGTCRWLCIATVQLRWDGPLGCLIVTELCKNCDDEHDSKHAYLGELAATSLLLRQLLWPRPDSDTYSLADHLCNDKINEAVQDGAVHEPNNHDCQSDGECKVEHGNKSISVSHSGTHEVQCNPSPTDVLIRPGSRHQHDPQPSPSH